MEFLNEINRLNGKDKPGLISKMWDNFDENLKSSLTDNQKKEFDKRLEFAKADKMKTFSWEEVKDSL